MIYFRLAILLSTVCASLPAVFASPIHGAAVHRSLSAVSISELDGFIPYAQFARAAYCGTSKVKNWTCGQACTANADFQPVLTGGDGDAVPYFFVGYWPSRASVVVAHEGTDPIQLLSVLDDAIIIKTGLDSSLFPGIPTGIEVHEGFKNAHQATASQILSQVKSLLTSTGANQVTVIGHSLGGALAELDCLFLTLNLGTGVAVKGMTFGTPRVGNVNFAAYFDATVSDFQRINNQIDPIPIVPGRFLEFSHVHGEIHILKQDYAVACSGDDDAVDAQCTISSVPNIFESNILNHLGPYQGVYIGTVYCT